MLLDLPLDLVARLLMVACAGNPGSILAWAPAAQRALAATRIFEDELWTTALASRVIRWPPSSSRRNLLLHALSKRGDCCRQLRVSLFACEAGDLAILANICTMPRMLRLDGICSHVELGADVWNHWGSAVTTLELHFIYDYVEGQPAMREVLQIVANCCIQLQVLVLTGVDHPGSKAACCSVLSARAGHFPALQSLWIRCADYIEFDVSEIESLQRENCLVKIDQYITGAAQ